MVTLLKAVLFVLGFRFAEGGGGLGGFVGACALETVEPSCFHSG